MMSGFRGLARPLRYIARRIGLRNSSTGSPASEPQNQKFGRLHRINSRLPRFLHRYTTPLLSAPVSHISSFLILHEISAIVPLLGLAGAFHYFQWLPESVVSGSWAQDGITRFTRYFKRKGWLPKDDNDDENAEVTKKEYDSDERRVDVVEMMDRSPAWRWVVEIAASYAVVKALLPVRIIFSVWATPWFARIAVLPVMRLFRRLGGKGTATTADISKLVKEAVKRSP